MATQPSWETTRTAGHFAARSAAIGAVALTVGSLWSSDLVSQTRLVLEEDLRIGDIDAPDYAFSRINSIVIDDAGHLFVGQPEEGEIRVFDSRGRALRTLGGQGRGPGEFEDIHTLSWHEGDLVVHDFAQNRTTILDREGREVRTIGAVPVDDTGLLRATAPRTILADGSFVVQPGASPGRVGRGEVTDVPLTVVAPDGQGRTVARLKISSQSAVYTLPPNSQVVAQNPFSTHTLWAADGAGQSLVVVDRPANPEGRFRVRRFGPDGRLLWSREYTRESRRITDRVADERIDASIAHIAELAERLGLTLNPRRHREIAREAFVVPSHFPSVSGILVSRTGDIWLAHPSSEDEPVRWTVLDPAGEVAAYATSPADATVFHVTDDAAWGTTTGDLDVPYLTRYRIVPQ